MADSIEKTIDLRRPVARVWRALTDYREFCAWCHVALDGPFVLGQPSTGRVTLPGYEHMRWDTRIVAMTPPEVFAFTWHPYPMDSRRDYSAEPATRVEFRLRGLPTGTGVSLTESGFDALPLARRIEARFMNERVWDYILRSLAGHVGG